MVFSWSFGFFHKTRNTRKCPVGARPAWLFGPWAAPQAFNSAPIPRHALHIAKLRQNFAKLRDRTCFKSHVRGGFYFTELDFHLGNFTARPHLHVLVETKEVAKT